MGKPKPLCTIEENLFLFEGIRPRAWISADTAFAREEIKKVFFDHGMGVSSETLVRPETIAALGLGIGTDRFLGSLARQELLRHLMGQSSILSFLPELKRMRRAQGFFKKLDQAIQAGRRVAGSDQEAETMDAVLARKMGKDPIREEVGRIAIAYETWLESENYWDDARLLQEWVIRFRARKPLSRDLKVPEKIFRLEALPDGGLVQAFWDSFSGIFPNTQVEKVDLLGDEPAARPDLFWGAWHTLDDAADALGAKLAQQMVDQGAAVLDDQVLLIPDDPSVRRSLNRALESHGVPSSDPRDPTRVRASESIKGFLLPLRLVAQGFDRKTVLTWAKSGQTRLDREKIGAAIREIEESGFRSGLRALSGPASAPLVAELSEVARTLPSRIGLSELKKALFDWAERAQGPVFHQSDGPWFETVFAQFEGDLLRTGSRVGKKAHPRWWLERLQDRIAQARPQVAIERPVHGIRISKLGQAPFSSVRDVHFFGLPARWCEGDSVGDLWLNDRAREILAQEFQISSIHRIQDSRKVLMESWRRAADQVYLWDAQYDWQGAERESLLTGLRDLGWEPRESEREPMTFGAHSRWIHSFSFVRPEPALDVKLRPIQDRGREEVSATDLDRQSRCGFLALGLSRWKLYDGRQAEPDLWGDVRGNLYHYAVRKLIEGRRPDGSFGANAEETTQAIRLAIDEAWKKIRPKGFLKSDRLIQSEKARMTKSLSVFCEKETLYVQNSGNQVLSLEGPKLSLDVVSPETKKTIRVAGIPDRLDTQGESADGVFVIDYKTSSGQPNGRQILDSEYALQLPFYSLAAAAHFRKRPIGFQFLTFDRVGRRTLGLFFSDWNFVKARKGGSLFTDAPEDVFSKLMEAVGKEAGRFADGIYPVAPKLPARECANCRVQDLCGTRRSLGLDSESTESEEGGG